MSYHERIQSLEILTLKLHRRAAFVNWKVINMTFGAITTFILKIDLKTGGGIWQEIEMSGFYDRLYIPMPFNRYW